jgi:hypothetical protein
MSAVEEAEAMLGLAESSVIPAWMPESSAMEGKALIAQVFDSVKVLVQSLPSLGAGFRHPCRNDGVFRQFRLKMRIAGSDCLSFWRIAVVIWTGNNC